MRLRITKRMVLMVVVSWLAMAIWFVAGYRVGFVKGKGWRDAVIADGCVIKCPALVITVTR